MFSKVVCKHSLEIGGLQDLCEADAVPVVFFAFDRFGGAASTRDVQRTGQPFYVITLGGRRARTQLVPLLYSTYVCTDLLYLGRQLARAS